MTERETLSYREAGVDREVANLAKSRILELLAGTATAGVVPNPGGFGGLFRIPDHYRSPLLVASADGVGTKVKVATRARRHAGVGHDIVNHCANDILVEGARPLFFLDYIGMGKLEAGAIEEIVGGVAAACRAAGCALLGGETAEMPDVYSEGEYDLAGFIVGVVDEQGRPGSHRVQNGDSLIGLAADGFHTNGYSLLRRLFFQTLGMEIDDAFPGLDATLGEVLLRPHRCYVSSVLPLIEDGTVHALAHITGGGITENLDRVMPSGLTADVDLSSWTPPIEFRTVADEGGVTSDEMLRTFNMGVGMVVAVDVTEADATVARLNGAGETAWQLGEVRSGERPVVFSGG